MLYCNFPILESGLGHILQTIIDWFLGLISAATAKLGEWIINTFLGNGSANIGTETGHFSPSLDYFAGMIGSGGEENYYLAPADLFSGYSGLSNFKKLQYIVMLFAGFLLIVIFTMELLQRLLGAVVEFRQSLASTLTRVAMSVFMIFATYPLVAKIMDLGTVAWEYLTDVMKDMNLIAGLTDKLNTSGGNGFLGVAEVALFVGTAGLGPLVMAIIQAILCVVMLYFLIKTTFEIIQHYLMVCVLAVFAPCSAAFFVSDDSIITFKTYWKMFMTEVGLLVFNMMWLRLSVVVVGHSTGIVGCFAAVAFMRIGTQANNIARALGLSTSGMTGTLVDSVALTAGGLAAGISAATHATGRVLANAGSYSGNTGLVRAGLIAQGKKAGFSDINRELQGNVGGILGRKMAEKSNGNHGRKWTPQAQKLAEAQIQSGTEGKRSLEAMLGQYSAPARQQFLQNMLDNGYFGALTTQKNAQGVALRAVDFTAGKGLQVEAGKYDPSKGVNGFADGSTIIKGTISDFDTSGCGAKFQSVSGDTLYWNPEGETGTPVRFEAGETPNGFSRVEDTLGQSIRSINPELFNDDGTLKQGVNIRDYQWTKNADGSISTLKKDASEGKISYNEVGSMGTVGNFAGALRNGTEGVSDYTFKDAADGGIDVLAPAKDEPDFSMELAEDSGIKAFADAHDGSFEGAYVASYEDENSGTVGWGIADADDNITPITQREALDLIEGGVGRDLNGCTVSEGEDGSITFSSRAYGPADEDGNCVVGHIDAESVKNNGLSAAEINDHKGEYDICCTDAGDYKLLHEEPVVGGYEAYSQTDTHGMTTYTGNFLESLNDKTCQTSVSYDDAKNAPEYISNPEDVIMAQFCHKGEAFTDRKGRVAYAAEEGAWADANIPHDKIQGIQISDDGSRFDVITKGTNGQDERTACYIGRHAAKNAGIELTHTNIARGNSDRGSLYYGKARKIETVVDGQQKTVENSLSGSDTNAFYRDAYGSADARSYTSREFRVQGTRREKRVDMVSKYRKNTKGYSKERYQYVRDHNHPQDA